MKVKSESEVAQSCPTLSDPMDCSLPGSSVHESFQARVLEWVAISLSTKLTLRFPNYWAFGPPLQTWIETDIKVPQFLGLWTSSETHIISSPGSQTFRFRLNYISDFFNSYILGRQFVGLLGLHSCVSQFLWSISSSVQFSSVAQSCLTLFDPMNLSTPVLPVHHQFPEFTQTHVHRVSDAIQPSHLLSSPSPPAPNPSQHQSLFQ